MKRTWISMFVIYDLAKAYQKIMQQKGYDHSPCGLITQRISFLHLRYSIELGQESNKKRFRSQTNLYSNVDNIIMITITEHMMAFSKNSHVEFST